MKTERLVLRPWRADDIEPLAAVFAEPAFWHFPFGRGLTREETETFLERQLEHWRVHGFGMWAAELRAERRLVGYVGLAVPTWLPQVLPSVEVGWRLHPAVWGRGLATEGGRASLSHGFEVLGLERIISIFVPDNVASGRVMTKLGMHDCLVADDPAHGVRVQVREITADEWRTARTRSPGSAGGGQPVTNEA